MSEDVNIPMSAAGYQQIAQELARRREEILMLRALLKEALPWVNPFWETDISEGNIRLEWLHKIKQLLEEGL